MLDERGSVTIEMTLLLPFSIFFILLIISILIFLFQSSVYKFSINKTLQNSIDGKEISEEVHIKNGILKKDLHYKGSDFYKFKWEGLWNFWGKENDLELYYDYKISFYDRSYFMNTIDFAQKSYNIYLENYSHDYYGDTYD